MQLTDEQKREVSEWIAGGAKLSDVQQKLEDKFGFRMTYMQARFLMDDLKVVPHEKPKPAPAKVPEPAPVPAGVAAPADKPGAAAPYSEVPPMGNVTVQVDQVMRPGALVSGSATFSDGVTAEWHLDQTGRFGLIPPKPGYRPSQEDFAEFRVVLEQELARLGL